jgi:hypothetical protein
MTLDHDGGTALACCRLPPQGSCRDTRLLTYPRTATNILPGDGRDAPESRPPSRLLWSLEWSSRRSNDFSRSASDSGSVVEQHKSSQLDTSPCGGCWREKKGQ